MTLMRSRKASLFLLDLNCCHSASFECARMMPWNGIGPERLGADVIAFLRRREQRVKHLDRRLEHLDEFEKSLIGPAQRAGIAVGVRIVLAVMLELSDIDLADERGDVLIVLVARLGLGDRDLAELRGKDAHDVEFGDVAAELVEPLHRPGADDAGEPSLLDAVFLFEQLAHLLRLEKPERRLEYRADLIARLEHVDRHAFPSDP